MNDVQCLIDRQLGYYSRLSYDNVLKRLVVFEQDSFYGLSAAGAEDPPIFACRFAEASGLEHILALANEDGRVAIQNISKSGDENSLEGYLCHNNAVFDLAWMPGAMNFVTVSGDHTACLWDVAEGPPRKVLAFQSHTRSVKTAVFRPFEPQVFATGARDGHILVWDIRASSQPAIVVKPDNCLMNCHSSCHPKTPGSHGKRPRIDTQRAISITGLVFRDEVTLISCGECDGNIKLWDLRKNYGSYTREPLPKHAIPYCGSSTRNGYTNLIVDESRTRLYASCMDSVVYCFNVGAYGTLPERRYLGHESGTFYIKTGLSPDGRYLVSGSSDKHAYVWNVQRSRPVVRLGGHAAEVTCAAWAKGAEPVLVTCGDDARHKVWRIAGEDRPPQGQLSGCAEAAPARELSPPPKWRPATPGSRKRRPPASTPTSDAKRPRRTKRCLADLLGAAPAKDPLLPAGSKRPLAAADECPSARAPVTPKKRPRSPGPSLLRSPLRASPTNVIATSSFSPPTRDLPDFVRTGDAPHLRLMSPVKRKLDGPDWLTALCRSKRARLPSPPPPSAAPVSPAPASTKDPPPRRGSGAERTPKSTTKTRTLLKYFKIAEKEN